MSKDKILQTLDLGDELLYAQSDRCTREIDVNIQLIWERCEDETKFIRKFSKTYTHEILHLLIDSILQELFEFGEEKVIRKMLKEEWNKELKKYYKGKKKIIQRLTSR